MTKTIIQYSDEHASISVSISSNGTSAGYSLLTFKAEQKARDQAWREANPERRKKITKDWEAAHPEKVKLCKQKYYMINSEECVKLSQIWAKINPEKVKAQDQRYTRTHRGKVTAAKHRAKRKQLGYKPINQWFPGCNGHHLNRTNIIYIPEWLHKSVSHSVLQDRNMKQMNELAMSWFKSEIKGEVNET